MRTCLALRLFNLTTCLAVSALALAALTGCRSASRETGAHPAVPSQPLPKVNTLSDLQQAAARYHAVVEVPAFETTTNAIQLSVETVMAGVNARLDALGRLPPAQTTLANTAAALDDIWQQVGLTSDRLYLIKETHPQAAMREAATEAIKKIQDWAVGLDYREDVYAAIKAYADRKPALAGEDAKLLAETLRDYRRIGLELPKEQRQEVERLRKDLARLSTDFSTHVTAASKTVTFTKAELAGVPEDFLAQPGIKTGPDQYSLKVNVTWQYLMIMDNARVAESRRRLQFERENLARDKNVTLLLDILKLRNRIAHRLGYRSWGDFQTEVKMARNEATARGFLENLQQGLQPKFDAEMALLRELKFKETGDPQAVIQSWDARYYINQLKKERYNVDAEKLRPYFSYDKVLQGMFDLYQRIFSLRIDLVEPPAPWVDDLRLYAVRDAVTGEPLGLFYLDMFPREGKYQHFAQFGLIKGMRRPDGLYQRPVVALVCNFPAPSPSQPSLLKHSEVETLFHEFGHALHSILTRASYRRFSGTSVPDDFVEAPSQMLENWIWDKSVLDGFAAHYQTGEKIPQDILDQLNAARFATEGMFYRRQLSFGLIDFALHAERQDGEDFDVVQVANDVAAKVYLAPQPDTAFVASFGHLMGYDAGYYGYAWADAIAADMATIFEQAPGGYNNAAAGLKLRREIYEAGDSRDINISIRQFLGRAPSNDPFLIKIGAKKP